MIENIMFMFTECMTLSCNINLNSSSLCVSFADRCIGLMTYEVLKTYVCVRTLVGSRTGEGDKLMASFVNHKTAHCQKREHTDL